MNFQTLGDDPYAVPRPLSLHSFELRDLFSESTAQNREATPGFRIEVFVVDMKPRRVAFALPLIPAPEAEEFDHPPFELLTIVAVMGFAHPLPNFARKLLIPDRQFLDRIEYRIGHQV